MSSPKIPIPHNRGRQLYKAESHICSSPQPTAQQRKLEAQAYQRYWTSSCAWATHSRGRRLNKAEPHTCSSPQPTAKRRKLEGQDHRRRRTSSCSLISETQVRQLNKAEPSICSAAQPIAQRREVDAQDHKRRRTPSCFWDNLSRQWLTRRTLREFDRREAQRTFLEPPPRTGIENINIAKLKRFAKNGGPSLADIRGYSDPAKSGHSQPIMESTDTPASRKTSAYDGAFQQHLIDNGIFPDGYSEMEDWEEPHNLDQIRARLETRRASLSPLNFTNKEFLSFKTNNGKALTEAGVMSQAFTAITGAANIPSQQNLQFTNFQNLTDGSITLAQPDFYDGARPEELKRQVRERLGPHIIPSKLQHAPCLPNFFAEGKGPRGEIGVAKRQAMYDGALGARGVLALRSYVNAEEAYDSKAYTIMVTYHPAGYLDIYTTHPVKSTDPDRKTEYRMTLLDSYAMLGNLESFRRGAAALRNARELARDMRRELITAANAKAEASGSGLSTQSHASVSANEAIQSDSDSSVDELSMDIVTVPRSKQNRGAGM